MREALSALVSGSCAAPERSSEIKACLSAYVVPKGPGIGGQPGPEGQSLDRDGELG